MRHRLPASMRPRSRHRRNLIDLAIASYTGTGAMFLFWAAPRLHEPERFTAFANRLAWSGIAVMCLVGIVALIVLGVAIWRGNRAGHRL